MSSDKTAIEVPEGYRALDVETLAPYLGEHPALQRAPGRRPFGLASGRGRRRQPEPRLPRARPRRRALREAGAALRAAGGRELAAAARPRVLRARGAGGARPPRTGAHARRLPLRPDPDADRDGAAGAAHHHAARHDPGHPLPARRHRHGGVHGAHALLHLRPRHACGREEDARCSLLRQHGALQAHRGRDLHRALHGPRQQLVDLAAARRRRCRHPRRCAAKARGLPPQVQVHGEAPKR